MGQRSLKVLKTVPFESLGTVSYSPSMVTMAVSLAISEFLSRVSVLTRDKNSPQKFNVLFRIIADDPGDYRLVPYILRGSFHEQHLPRR